MLGCGASPTKWWRTGDPSIGGLVVGWLLLVALGVIWGAFLVPTRRTSHSRSIEDFERNMDLLADTEGNGRGRWIVTPRKGVAFVGTRERARERSRARRRRVFVFMIESTGIAFLIGLVPPLRAMWLVAGSLMILLALYTWLLVTLREREGPASRRPVGRVQVNGSAHTVDESARHTTKGQRSNGQAVHNGHASNGRAAPGGQASNGRPVHNGHANGHAVYNGHANGHAVHNAQASNGHASNGHGVHNGQANGHAFFDADEFVNIVVRSREREPDIQRAGVAGI
jgi:hypothetical protein